MTQVRLNPTTESNVVTYEVVVAAKNPEHKLIPGLTANLTIYTLSDEDVLLLPASAFNFQPEADTDSKLPQPEGSAADLKLARNQKCVWAVKGDRLVPTAVTIGKSNGIKTEILGGIEDGAIVATGYDVMAEAPSGKPDQQSPFAPQPPGRKKK